MLRGGVAEALARTAAMVREDLDALDELTPAPGTMAVDELAALTPGIRRRTIRAWLREHGVTPTATHVTAVDALVTDWHGQGPVALPAALEARRRSGRLHLADSASRTGNGAQLRR